MKTPKSDREVVVTFMTNEDLADVYTSDYRFMNKFDKLCEINPDEWKCIRIDRCEGDMCGKLYQCPTNFISFRSKSRTVKEKTEEERETQRERMRQLNLAKQSKTAIQT